MTFGGVTINFYFTADARVTILPYVIKTETVTVCWESALTSMIVGVSTEIRGIYEVFQRTLESFLIHPFGIKAT